MKKTSLLILLTALLLFPTRTQAQDDVSRIIRHFTNVAQYDSRCTQEKVYLHLDNNAYFIDETLYFKAYVVRASSLKYTDLSKVLYVELLDDHGNTLERKSYEITQGQASGSIELKNLIHGGYYEIRAFTRAMLNWDGEYCFSRVVPVYQAKDTANIIQSAFIYKDEGEDHVPMKRPESNTLRGDSAIKNDFYVEMYPEGGALIEVKSPQRVAYRITDKAGNPISFAECKLSNSAVTSKPMHEGMGDFVIPSWESGAKLQVTVDGKMREFSIPTARKSGIAATLQNTSDSITIDISQTPDLTGKYLGVGVTCRGAACMFDTVRLAEKTRWAVAKKRLHFGINQITIINADGDVLWERLVWRKPEYPVSLTVRQNEEVYQPYAPIVLDMKLADTKGNPCNSYFSIAVHDQDLELSGNDVGIMTDLLLSSDLRGYIARPEEYFSSDDETHSKWLDLLLLVQGWRRYDFDEMTGKKPFVLKQPVETGQLLTGYLLANKGKRLPMANADLKLELFIPGILGTGECKTDSTGSFAMMAPKYYGDGIGRFYTYENGKAKTMRIKLDRNFAPDNRMLDPQEFSLSSYLHSQAAMKTEIFEWKDTITKGDILLGEAVVKGKRTDMRDGQDRWNGGEGFAIRNADIMYNIGYETVKYCDEGEDEPMLWDLLKSLNKHFDYTTGDSQIAGTTYDLTYRNRKAVVFRHNMEQSNEAHMDNMEYMASDVSRVYIVTDPEKVRRVLPEYAPNGEQVTAIMLYGDGLPMNMKEKRKTKVVRFSGYSSDPEFVSPDYRKRDLPDVKDYRRTLYWNPDVLADENGQATIMFYSNARPNVKLGITARGVLPDGEIIDYAR